MFCIPKYAAEKMKKAIVSGEFTPEKFKSLNSTEARKQLTKIIGNEIDAKAINLLFEKKLLLKNQELAMYSFARDVIGLSKEQKEATSKKIKETYAKKREMIEAPTGRFLEEIIADTYSKKVKADIDLDTAESIIKLSKSFKLAEEKWQNALDENGNYKNPKDEFTIGLNYGVKRQAFEKFIEIQKMEAKKKSYGLLATNKPVTENAKTIARNIKTFGVGGLFDFIGDNSRALKASFDNSFVGRQARKAIQPRFRKEWWSMFWKSFRDINRVLTADFTGGNWKTLKTKQGLKNFFLNTTVLAKAEAILDAEKASIYARPNFAKGRYDSKEGKLDIGVREEETPTSLPSKLPLVGRFFAASEIAYNISAMRLRADIADNLYELAESKETRLSETFKNIPVLKKVFAKEVIDLNDDFQVGSINKVVNDMTGRGKISNRIIGEKGQQALNKAVFSVKFAQSQLNTLLSWAYFGSRSKFARKQAAKNLLWLVASSYIIQGMFGLYDDDSTEEDLTSADSGKIKFGNTRFDTTGGFGSYMTALARIITKERKSTITGLKTKIGEDYGSGEVMDIFWNMIENKTSPIASAIKNAINRKTFEGEKLTPQNILTDLTIPIIFETGIDAYKLDNGAMMIASLILDGLGVSANTYAYSGNWENSTSKWAKKFKLEKGLKKLRKAGEEYDKEVNDRILELRKDSKFKKKTDEDKLKELNKEKRRIKKAIFKKYNFKD